MKIWMLCRSGRCNLLATCWGVVAGLALPSGAQLQPDRTYYGINRPVPMTVAVPTGEGQPAGEVRIDLFEPGVPEAVATAPVLAGPIDMAALFPVLWTSPTPKLRYAQLVVGGEQVGPPVVLQPMVSPARAYLVERRAATAPAGDATARQPRRVWWIDPQVGSPNFDLREGGIEWVGEPPLVSGVRAYVDKHVVLETSAGRMEFRLRPDVAPNTVHAFRELAGGGFYTDVIVHRVVNVLPSGAPFVVQFGDPTGTGQGGPGFAQDLEQSTLPHDFGVLSMARDRDPNTNGSQVFVALSREGTRQLDGLYTSFGELVDGVDALLTLARTPVRGDRPIEPPVVRSAVLVDAPAWGKRPPAVRRPQAPTSPQR